MLSAPPRTAPLRSLVVAAVLGVVAGVAAKAADESSWARAAQLGTEPAVWVLVVAVIASTAPSIPAAAVRAAAFFAAMTVAYYAWASLVLGFPGTWLLPAWLVLSVTAVALTAACVRWAVVRPGPLPGLLLAGVAGVALAGGSVLRLHHAWAGDLPWDAVRPVQVAAELATAAVVALVLPLHRSTRLWAAALLLPAAWAAWQVVQLLYGVLV